MGSVYIVRWLTSHYLFSPHQSSKKSAVKSSGGTLGRTPLGDSYLHHASTPAAVDSPLLGLTVRSTSQKGWDGRRRQRAPDGGYPSDLTRAGRY